MLKKYFFGFVCILFLSQSAFSQAKDDYIKMGDQYFAEGDYYTAAQFYKKLMKKKNPDIHIVYKYAEASRLYFYYQDAEQWYEYVFKKDTKDKFPLSSFWLATMEKNNGKYDEAKMIFEKYFEKHKNDNDYYSKTASHEIEACDFAKKILHDTLPVDIIHLDSNINSVNSEFDAYQMNDSVLMYSSLRKISNDKQVADESPANIYSPGNFTSRIFESTKKNKTWSKGKELDITINEPESNNANITLIAGNKKIFFTRCYDSKNKGMICSIYTSELKNSKWQMPTELNKKINMPGYTSTQPFATALDSNKTILFFVSDRPGGIGGLDIWSSILEKNKYSEPVNLGTKINTIGNEISPFYDASTKTFYFSSDWQNGLGGYDIFKSKGLPDQLNDPENMGFPFNTSFNDLYFTMNKKDSNGYITSNRPGSFYEKALTCCNDIFYFKWKKDTTKKPTIVFVDTVKHTVKKGISQSTEIYSPLSLYFPNDEPDPKSFDIHTRKNYLNILNDYISLKQEYISEYSKDMNAEKKLLAEKEAEDFFNKNVSLVEPKLHSFLQKVLSHLEQKDTLKLLIQGFCSPLNESEYNLNLSKRRIECFENFLKEYEKGIFAKFIKNKQLNFVEAPYGKEKANSKVSDNLNDKRNSVYSPAAGLERKIEISIIK